MESTVDDASNGDACAREFQQPMLNDEVDMQKNTTNRRPTLLEEEFGGVESFTDSRELQSNESEKHEKRLYKTSQPTQPRRASKSHAPSISEQLEDESSYCMRVSCMFDGFREWDEMASEEPLWEGMNEELPKQQQVKGSSPLLPCIDGCNLSSREMLCEK